MLSAYAVERLLSRIIHHISKPNLNLAGKIIKLFESDDNKANLATIYETLFSHMEEQSMNLALSQFQDTFNGATKATKEKAICLISKNIEDRMNNQWIWFEVTQQDQPEAMNRDLASVTQFQNQHVIDIKPLPTIVIVNYNEHEFGAIREIFDHDKQNILPDSREHLTAFNLGICGKFEVKHVYYSSQGDKSGYTSADDIYKDFMPYAILSVGIGYASVDEIKIGNVLVPKFITDANNMRVNSNGDITPNGQPHCDVSLHLYDKLHIIDKLKTQSNDLEWPKIHNWGGIISKCVHMNNIKERDLLKRDFNPNAMGCNKQRHRISKSINLHANTVFQNNQRSKRNADGL